MINSDDVTKENIKEWDLNWSQMSDHLNGILIIWRHRIWKNNFLFNLINHKPAIEKFYLYAKDSFEAKYQSLINRRERTGLKHFNVSKIFFDIQIVWMIFIKVLTNTNQIKNNIDHF